MRSLADVDGLKNNKIGITIPGELGKARPFYRMVSIHM